MTVHVEPRVLIAQETLPAHDVHRRTPAYLSALDGIRQSMAGRLADSGRRRVPGFETMAITYARLDQVTVGDDGRVDAIYSACGRPDASVALVTLKWPLMPGEPGT